MVRWIPSSLDRDSMDAPHARLLISAATSDASRLDEGERCPAWGIRPGLPQRQVGHRSVVDYGHRAGGPSVDIAEGQRKPHEGFVSRQRAPRWRRKKVTAASLDAVNADS